VNTLNNKILGGELATKFNLPGAERLFEQKFEQLCQTGQWSRAIKVASEIEGLRTQTTLSLFERAPQPPNQAPYDLQYFQLLLQKTSLNKHESLGLCTRI